MAGPTSVFSRSTESHNQDKVSMGTISAREAHRILELAETVGVIHLLALCQAVDLRGPDAVGEGSRAVWEAVRARVPKNDADRRMDVDIQAALAMYRAGELPLGATDFS
jgi:histidine ammonia-lyase